MDSDKPVIAAVNGAAFAGGLGLVGAADIVIAVEDVQFSFSEVRIGVIPGGDFRRLHTQIRYSPCDEVVPDGRTIHRRASG